MEPSPPRFNTLPIVIMWLAIAFGVAIASYGSPVSAWAVDYCHIRPFFALFLLWPPTFYLGYLFVRWLVSGDSAWQPNLNLMLSILVLYGLYVVSMTGGIVNSPLTPLCGMIPIIAGRYCGDGFRKRVLGLYLIGIILVGALSLSNTIAPPDEYPSNGLWDSIPLWLRADVWIATIAIGSGVAMELSLSRLSSNLTAKS